jgi:hypothetical protein
VVTVRDQGGAVESAPGAQADAGGDLVADVSDHPCACQRPEMLKLLRVQQPQDSLVKGDAGGNEDSHDDCVAGPALGAAAAKEEGPLGLTLASRAPRDETCAEL